MIIWFWTKLAVLDVDKYILLYYYIYISNENLKTEKNSQNRDCFYIDPSVDRPFLAKKKASFWYTFNREIYMQNIASVKFILWYFFDQHKLS